MSESEQTVPRPIGYNSISASDPIANDDIAATLAGYLTASPEKFAYAFKDSSSNPGTHTIILFAFNQ